MLAASPSRSRVCGAKRMEIKTRRRFSFAPSGSFGLGLSADGSSKGRISFSLTTFCSQGDVAPGEKRARKLDRGNKCGRDGDNFSNCAKDCRADDDPSLQGCLTQHLRGPSRKTTTINRLNHLCLAPASLSTNSWSLARAAAGPL